MAALRGEQAAREPVDVPALLEKAARTVAPKAAARGVALEPVQADACTVQGEAALLESLMVNLADLFWKRLVGLEITFEDGGALDVELATVRVACVSDE